MIVGSLASGYANQKNAQYYGSLAGDVQQYYSDYLKNTGIKESEVKYPYKSGYNDYQKYSNMALTYNAGAVSSYESAISQSVYWMAKVYG